MRILLTCHQFLPETSTGTEVLTLNTARELRSAGHEVHILTSRVPPRPDEPPSFDRYEYDGLPIERYRIGRGVGTEPARAMEAEYRSDFVRTHVRTYLARIRPDIVHAYHLQRLSTAVIDAAREQGIPVVFTPTDFWFMCPAFQLRLPDGTPCRGPDAHAINCFRHMNRAFRPKWARLLRPWPAAILNPFFRWLLRRRPRSSLARNVAALQAREDVVRTQLASVSRILAPSTVIRDALWSHGLPPGKIQMLPFGMDVKAPTTARARPAGAPLTIGFIGTLGASKGAHVLIEAVRLLPPEVAVRVRVYGALAPRTTYVRRLQALSAGDARIELAGTFDNARIGEVLSGMDMLCVPSTWQENTPLVLYSAAAARVPAIVSDMPGLTQLVKDGESGLVFPAGDSAALSSRLADLVRNPQKLEGFSCRIEPPLSMREYSTELIRCYGEALQQRIHA